MFRTFCCFACTIFPKKTSILEKEDLADALIKTDGKSLFFVTGLQLETLAPRDPTSKD